MRGLNWIAMGVMALSLNGCIETAEWYHSTYDKPEDIAQEDTLVIAAYYNDSHRQVFKDELIKRQAIDSGDWDYIDQGQLRIGMSTAAVIASWGVGDAVSARLSGRGRLEKWRYCYQLKCKRPYILLLNDELVQVDE